MASLSLPWGSLALVLPVFRDRRAFEKKQQVDVAKTLAGAVRSQHGYVPLSRFINPVDRSGLLAFLPQVHFLL